MIIGNTKSRVIKNFSNDNIILLIKSGIWYVRATKSYIYQNTSFFLSGRWTENDVMLSSLYTYGNVLFILPKQYKYFFSFSKYHNICPEIYLYYSVDLHQSPFHFSQSDESRIKNASAMGSLPSTLGTIDHTTVRSTFVTNCVYLIFGVASTLELMSGRGTIDNISSCNIFQNSLLIFR